jgi:hypothetical protein
MIPNYATERAIIKYRAILLAMQLREFFIVAPVIFNTQLPPESGI